MEKLSRFARSFNETHRICTHEISGHLHLLRFCIDELVEQLGDDNQLAEKIEEGVTKLEEMNKLWKICSRYHDPFGVIELDGLAEKAIGLVTLYNGKFIKEINYIVEGELELATDEGILFIEAIYAAASLASFFAIRDHQKELYFKISGHLLNNGEREVKITSNVSKFSIEEANAILDNGNENEKTQRRFNGVELVKENNGTYSIELDNNFLSVRIRL
ncbi:hypothetical protein [Bacteriovorax sp. Seq25_V]|uniref:hypothetical protein n=1 Tax=Bacteriovorax sp. Seq25_V TaxID=1201288 RepID=UPI000389F905|nr:hypothetical protein [Bacteriovorax sp. Seq25_V]EQC45723.1 hypothetical protein M900_1910 [Bacteriovorax sp. Seq25_V]